MIYIFICDLSALRISGTQKREPFFAESFTFEHVGELYGKLLTLKRPCKLNREIIWRRVYPRSRGGHSARGIVMHFPYIAFFIMSIVSLHDDAKMATISDIAGEGRLFSRYIAVAP